MKIHKKYDGIMHYIFGLPKLFSSLLLAVISVLSFIDKKILAFFFLLLSPSLALAASVTVCDSGCNYTTIASALTSVGSGSHAITVQSPYSAAEIVPISQSGTDDANRLVIQGRTGDTVTVKGFNVTGSYITIKNFRFAGFDRALDGSIELSGSSSYITIDSNSFYNNVTNVYTIHRASGFSSNVIISNNLFDTSKMICISMRANNMLITGNTWVSTGGWDVMRLWGDTVTVSSNIVNNVPEDVNQHMDFIQTFGYENDIARNFIIEKNLIKDFPGQIFNLSNDYSAAGNMGNWIVRNNIFYRTRYNTNVSIPNVKFYNNTFAQASFDQYGIMGGQSPLNCSPSSNCAGDCSGIEIKNNMFIGGTSNTGWYALDCPTKTTDYNYAANISGYGAKSGFSETHGINGGDPKFINITSNWNIQSGSRAIDKGTTISGFSTDYAGTSRPQGSAWDIGAYECSGCTPYTGTTIQQGLTPMFPGSIQIK